MDLVDEKLLTLDKWESNVSCYEEEQVGECRIHKTTYKKGYYHMYGVYGYIFFKAKKPLTITTLQERRKGKWEDWMVDDPPHYYAMEIYGKYAEGNVLVAGLGLGMLVKELAKNPKVTKITVIENSSDMVGLVSPKLPKDERIEIVLGDFYKYVSQDKESRDHIIVDLWVTDCEEEGRRVFTDEVVPLVWSLKQKYPKAKMTFHGFMSWSDIDPTKYEMKVNL